MHNYENTYGSLPAGIKGCCWGTWIVFVLPMMEQTAAYSGWNFNGDNSAAGAAGGSGWSGLRYGGAANLTISRTLFNVYTCPSDQPAKPLSGIPSYNYAANFGNTTFYQLATIGSGAATVNYLRAPFSDMWPNPAVNRGPKGYTVSQYGTVNLAAIRDGTSNTLLISEIVQGKSPSDLRGFVHWGYAAAFETNLVPNSRLPDVLWANYCDPDNLAGAPPCIIQSLASHTILGSRSKHPGGVNSLLADGHVQFIKDSVNLQTWRGLGSIDGGEVISADSF